MARAKTLAKSTSVQSNIVSAVDKLAAACVAGDRAVGVRARDARKNTALVKRLGKRRAALNKRRISAKRRLSKSPSADLRRDLRATEKELKQTTKELSRCRGTKDLNAAELAAMKRAARRANAYYRAIQKVERTLD